MTIESFAGNDCGLFVYPGESGGDGVLSKHIPGAVGFSDAVLRLVWPMTPDMIVGIVDGWFRRHLVASVFGLPGWAANLSVGPVQFNQGLYTNKVMLKKLLPPCGDGEDEDNCPYRDDTRDYSDLGRRILERYLKGFKHIMFSSCSGRSLSAMAGLANGVGFGRSEGYTFVEHSGVMAAGFGNNGVIGWMKSNMDDVILHGNDNDWADTLKTAGCISAYGENFWTGFLYSFAEMVSPMHIRPTAITKAFMNNDMSAFVFRGARNDEKATFRARFETTLGRVNHNLTEEISKASSECAVEEPVETNRIIHGNFAYAAGLEALCDTVIVGPEVMPKASYKSKREGGTCNVKCEFNEESVKFSYNTANYRWEFNGEGIEFRPSTTRKWVALDEPSVDQVTSRVYALAVNTPRGVEGSADISITSPSGLLVYLGNDDLSTIASLYSARDPDWLEFSNPQIINRDTMLGVYFRYGASESTGVWTVELDEDALDVNLIASARLRASMDRVISERKPMQYATIDWPYLPSPGLYPHTMFSSADNGPTVRKFHPTFLLSFRVYAESLAEKVAGEDSLIDDDEPMYDKGWRMYGGKYDPFYAGNAPQFAFNAWSEMERKARAGVIAAAGGNDFVSVNLESAVKNTLTEGRCQDKAVELVKEASKNMVAHLTVTEQRKYRVFVSGGVVDTSRVETSVLDGHAWSDWEACSLPLWFNVDISIESSGATVIPSELINYSDASADASSYGIAAVVWRTGRMDPNESVG